jgi:putative Holliday junction resolvase
LSAPGRALGLDLGDVRIGIAISDDARRLAVPLGTVHVGRPPGELRAIAELARENDVSVVVVGLPLSLDGSRGPRAALAEAFAESLRAVVSVPIVFHDERLTTVEAERGLRDACVKGRDRRAVVDAEAARILLQSWLETSAGDPKPG